MTKAASALINSTMGCNNSARSDTSPSMKRPGASILRNRQSRPALSILDVEGNNNNIPGLSIQGTGGNSPGLGSGGSSPGLSVFDTQGNNLSLLNPDISGSAISLNVESAELSPPTSPSLCYLHPDTLKLPLLSPTCSVQLTRSQPNTSRQKKRVHFSDDVLEKMSSKSDSTSYRMKYQSKMPEFDPPPRLWQKSELRNCVPDIIWKHSAKNQQALYRTETSNRTPIPDSRPSGLTRMPILDSLPSIFERYKVTAVRKFESPNRGDTDNNNGDTKTESEALSPQLHLKVCQSEGSQHCMGSQAEHDMCSHPNKCSGKDITLDIKPNTAYCKPDLFDVKTDWLTETSEPLKVKNDNLRNLQSPLPSVKSTSNFRNLHSPLPSIRHMPGTSSWRPKKFVMEYASKSVDYLDNELKNNTTATKPGSETLNVDVLVTEHSKYSKRGFNIGDTQDLRVQLRKLRNPAIS